MKLGLETEIRLKIEAIEAIGETNYDRLRAVRPDLSIIEIHQLAVAHARLHAPSRGIQNAEYRYNSLRQENPNGKTINDYCEQERSQYRRCQKAMFLKFNIAYALLVLSSIVGIYMFFEAVK